MASPRSEIKRCARALRPVLPFRWEAPDILGEGGGCSLSKKYISGLGWLARVSGRVTDRSRYLELFSLITHASPDSNGQTEFRHYEFLDGGIIASVGQATSDAPSRVLALPEEIEAVMKCGQELIQQTRDPIKADYLQVARLLGAGIAYYNNHPQIPS